MIRTLLISTALVFTPAAIAQDHKTHNDHVHDHGAYEHHEDDQATHEETPIALYRTPEIEAALAAGGEPVVVEVLGVVCDFCAKAMNRTFGRRDEVLAVYVDLDTKTLNLVLASEGAMDNEEINRVVERSGYKSKAIHRGEHVLGGSDARRPA